VLENIWLIPAVTAASFFLIIFFGKRDPNKGATIGVLALGLAFAFSTIAAVQWIGRPADYTPEPTESVESVEGEGSNHDLEESGGGGSNHDLEESAPAGGGVGGRGQTVLGVVEPEGGEGGEEEHPTIRRSVERRWEWFNNGQIKVEAGTSADGLAIALCFVVSLISLLVHIFSFSYMHGDERFTHYYAALSLFTTGMFVLVTSSNTLQALFGWELMGLCSFMLIGHWWDRDGNKNSNAALKAFFTTRTGDVGLLVGITVLFFGAGETFDIQSINNAALSGEIPRTVLVAGAAALLVAVIGKSAQFPLHTWLPDAMAGPTPVSALIHAATMVVAGVYLIARLYGVFWEAFLIGEGGYGGWNPIAVVGGITILIAAALAFVQRDIKKVLAYSTVSQLGFMVMALGVGAWTAAIFHLFTHAFFKACLFLGAGSISHSGSHHSFDMISDMGGLKDKMPWTYRTFLVATLALAGVPPLAGFWSKDEILLGAGEGGYELFLIVGLVGAFMTAAYMTRCVYLTFFGEARGAAAHHHPHESPPLIVVPLQILAVFSVFAGFLNAPGILLFTEWTNNETVTNAGVEHHEFALTTAALSVAVGLGGILTAGLYYWRGLRFPITSEGAGKPVYKLLQNKYYLDALYEGVIVRGIREPISRGAYWFNQKVLDGVVNGAGVAARGLARFVYEIVDQKGVDGIVNGAGLASEGSGSLLRHIQTGRVQQYAALMLGAVGVFALALVLL